MYQPSEEILRKYADVLINFAPRDGQWIRKGERVHILMSESAKPLLIHLQRAVLKAGAYPFIDFKPEGIEKEYYELANEDQLREIPMDIALGKVSDIDYMLYVHSEVDKHELDNIDSAKMMEKIKSKKPVIEARNKKEHAWKFFWCYSMYATQSMADEVWLSLEEYWQEIIKACFLDHDDPIVKRKEVAAQIEETRKKLTDMHIEKVHVVGEDVDLHIQLWANRKWLAWWGNNIPSFEIFTSPNWKWTNGWIRISEPLYHYGSIIKWIELHFENGVVTKATAKENEKALLDMIAVEHADKLGEFSLTDRRTSRITKFMWETLFDENVGWLYGNTHIAIGASFHSTYTGDVQSPSQDEWFEMWFNSSVVHTDMVSTTNRTVTATLQDWTEKVIYKDGEFVL